jgi:NhaP-type Na+/H+ or K+/H+ antiporter
MALLFAALMVVTGPTVINPLLRTMRAKPEVSQILRWEGILIDPVGALMAVLVYQFIIAGKASYQLGLISVAAGLAVGAVAALALGFVLRRRWVPEYLLNTVTLAVVVLAFAGSDYLAHESGLLAVTVMGIWLANMRGLDMTEILSFKESLSILIISMLFIVLGARLNPADMFAIGWQGAVLLAVVLLARPVVVWAAMVGGEYSWQQKALVAWVGPRGIVAAAVSSIFALRLQEAGFSDAFMLVPYTFLIIIFTVVLQSVTARPMAKFLGLMEEEPKGILIAGANTVARTIGLALAAQGFRVKLTDTNWSALREARMAGLGTYYGNLVSVHADQHLDLAGMGRLFAMSPRPSFNTLACLKYKTEFGAQRVFTLRTAEEKGDSDKQRVAQHYQAPRLFGEDVTMQKLSSLIAQGAEIKATLLSEDFNLETYQQANDKNIILLFAIDPQERLRAFTDEYTPEVEAGWTLLTLVPSAEN